MEGIKKRLQEVFVETFDDEEIVISSETTADDIEDWDSLMHVTLMVAVEKEFGIKFKAGEIKKLADVGELMKSIEEKING